MKSQIIDKILQIFQTFIPNKKASLSIIITKQLKNLQHFLYVIATREYHKKEVSQ